MTGTPITFAAVAQQLAEQGWRPFPGFQASKTPAMRGWPGLNHAEWDNADLLAAIADYQPTDDYCCCLAVQPEIVAIDLDIIDQEHAAAADRLANDILGKTPLVRIGFAPKQIRLYRSGDAIRSRKLHPLEIFSGTGQFIAYGWHQKAGRPYIWPQCSPLDVSADSDTIPLVTRAQLDRFSAELFKVVPRRLLPTRQGRPGEHRWSANNRRAVERCCPCCTAAGSAPQPSCSAKPSKAAGTIPRGLWSHQLPGAGFLTMSSGNYSRGTSADGTKFPKPRSPR